MNTYELQNAELDLWEVNHILKLRKCRTRYTWIGWKDSECSFYMPVFILCEPRMLTSLACVVGKIWMKVTKIMFLCHSSHVFKLFELPSVHWERPCPWCCNMWLSILSTLMCLPLLLTLSHHILWLSLPSFPSCLILFAPTSEIRSLDSCLSPFMTMLVNVTGLKRPGSFKD